MNERIADLKFGPDGLVPAVVQDAEDGTVLMVVEMNQAALSLTLQNGVTYAWSRSQHCVYKPGEEVSEVIDVKYSDSGDTLLIQVRRVPGQAGQRSCFSHSLLAPTYTAASGATSPTVTEMPGALYDLILHRRESGDKNSYVRGLFRRGQDVICKKVAEEAAEVVIASKNQAPAEIVYEMADLWFHATILLGYHTIHPHDVWRELQRRFGQPGGGKIPDSERSKASSETASG